MKFLLMLSVLITCIIGISTVLPSDAIESDKIIPPPLKQMKMGIKLGHIICDDGMTPTWSVHLKPACVFSDSEIKLLERGWAKLRLVLPGSPDPIKELEWTGQNEVTYRILGNMRYGDEPPPSTLDEKKKIVWEYAQRYHPEEKFLEYSIPTNMYHFNVGDAVQFDLLEWGNYSDCWDLKLRIIDVQDQPVYEDNSVEFCLESSTDGRPGWFASYSAGEELDEFVCDRAGYYRIEASNGEIFSPTVLKNFACFDKSKTERHAKAPDIERFLMQNRIDYRSDRLVITTGISTGGDPGCGVVMDMKNQTHWFAMDSISKPQKMTLYSENPHQCVVNTVSCFCNAQMELAALTLDELSYFSPEEEERFSGILIGYLSKENINTTPKFKIGKFNLNYTDPSAIGYCGELWGYNKYDFFDGAIVDNEIRDYGLAGELSSLCAISKDAKWWERKSIKDNVSSAEYDPYNTRCGSGVIPAISENWQSSGLHPSDENWENLGRHLVQQKFYQELKDRDVIFEPACFEVHTGQIEESYPPRFAMCSMITASNGTRLYLEGTVSEFDVSYFNIDNKIPYQCDEHHFGCLCQVQ